MEHMRERNSSLKRNARFSGPVGQKTNLTRTYKQYCLPPGIATCYSRFVNTSIFYIIGVIVVIVIVLKVLHVF
jgi:hypothetical protein